MERLISMTDFVLEQNTKWEYETDAMTHLSIIIGYAEFLKQPLTLGMFVPCDEDGNIMDEPKTCCSGRECGCMGMPYNYFSREELNGYEEALNRVLFEGFHLIGDKEIELKGTDNWFVFNEKSIEFSNEFSQEKYVYKVDDLVELELILTESAKKQIGL